MWLGLSPARLPSTLHAVMHLQIVEANAQLTRRYVANGPHRPAMWIARGTEQAPGMLGGQLFEPGGDHHSQILDRWAANAGRRKGRGRARFRAPSVDPSFFVSLRLTQRFQGAYNEHRPRQLGSRLCAP